MFEFGVTSELFRVLVSQGEIKPAGGTVGWGKGAGDAGGVFPQRPLTDAAAGEPRIRLVFVNPNMTKPAERRTNRAGLVMVGE